MAGILGIQRRGRLRVCLIQGLAFVPSLLCLKRYLQPQAGSKTAAGAPRPSSAQRKKRACLSLWLSPGKGETFWRTYTDFIHCSSACTGSQVQSRTSLQKRWDRLQTSRAPLGLSRCPPPLSHGAPSGRVEAEPKPEATREKGKRGRRGNKACPLQTMPISESVSCGDKRDMGQRTHELML